MSRTRRARLVGVLVIPLVVTALAAIGLGAGVLAGFQQRSTDALWPSGGVDQRVVVVAIDDAALAAVNQPWPWDRTVWARLVDRLHADGAKAVGIDVLFADRRVGDNAFAASMRRAGNVALAVSPQGVTGSSDGTLQVARIAPPEASLARSASRVGHSLLLPDEDGVIRSVPLVVVGPDGEPFTALPVSTVELLEGRSSAVTQRRDGLDLGGRFIPTSGDQRMTISWPQGLLDSSAVISAADVLNGSAASRVRGAAVLVGPTDSTLISGVSVPPDPRGGVPPVIVEGAALNTILSQRYVDQAPRWLLLLLVLGSALLGACGALLLSVRTGWLVLPVGAAAIVGASFVAFDRGTTLDLVYPLIALVAAYGIGLAMRSATRDREYARVSGLLGQYVPPDVARDLAETRRLDQVLAGERLEASILFCDLRGFTPLSASHTAQEIRAVLDHFYEYVGDIVLAHGGTVLQYIGDEVLAVFGAPVPTDDSAHEAVAAAVALVDSVDDLNTRLTSEHLPPVSFGVGLHRGPVIAAHVGTETRRQYSVIGDTVNVASRITGRAATGTVLASRAAVPTSMDGEFSTTAELQLKGVAEDVTVLGAGRGEVRG